MEKIFGTLLTIALGVGTLLGSPDNGQYIIQKIFEDFSENTISSDALKRFNSEEELRKTIDNYYQDYEVEINFATDAVADGTTIRSEAQAEIKDSYSETNVQVTGVDEADIVKTDGNFIYYLVYDKLVIAEVRNPEDISIKKIIEVNEKASKDYYCSPSELYIDEDYIVVISNKAKYYYDINEAEDFGLYRGGASEQQLSLINIYDISTYNLVRSFEISGNYISSRKIDDDLYLISNMYINKNLPILPVYCDTAETKEYIDIEADSIYYFDDIKECSYMIISSISLDNMERKANIDTFLGAGSEIYVSKDSLFVAKINYNWNAEDVTTNVHKFDINNGNVKYVATGIVQGRLLNQFSMDEHDGYFRITTTTNAFLDESENNLYVLDEKMNAVGKIEGLAKGERIYSTRFMGDKCYVVTYKTVDPLFVIDLSNPTEPKVLGELKIPGYSSYLHPLGENYLIGFGEDSVEKSYINWRGESEVTAYATGLKLAIFDITDFYNPKELYSIKIGGRGSYSELLNNHKVLLFDEEKGIFAFPARVYSEGEMYDDGVPAYGKLEFSGALIYNLSVEDGISLRGKISHNDERPDYNDIQRIIYIGDVLYTLSPDKIVASDLKTIERLGEVNIEIENEKIIFDGVAYR